MIFSICFYKVSEISDKDGAVKEQIGCRVEPHVKKILDEISKKEFRTIANLSEKLICERLQDLGYLDENFMPIEKAKSNK